MARIALKELESDRSLAVEQLESLIGRDPACGFIIDGPKSKVVSGRHARIFYQDNTWWIQDMSRNGTILDDERLQNGQRHALKVGQIIGLGESGPRLRVAALESRAISETMVEQPGFGAPPKTTAPRQRPLGAPPSGVSAQEEAAAVRKPEVQRAPLKFEEPTEPARLGGAWHLTVKLRATHSDQLFEAKATVVKVGRSPECGIRIPPEQGAAVSRVHAEIAVGDAGVVVRDAGSRNGTFLNGARVEGAQPLIVGDRVMLGTGGPTFEVEELRIVKGTGPHDPVSPRIGGAKTPESFPARQGKEAFDEPPTAPSEVDELKRAVPPGTRPVPPPKSPARGVQQQPPTPASPPDRSRLAIYVAVGVIIVALAILIVRITTS